MAVNWPSGVSYKAYGMNLSPANNVEEVTFESGMKRTYQKDLRGKVTASLTFTFKDDNTPSCSFRLFWDWYKNRLLTRANTFYFPDLITHSTLTEYRMTSEPSIRGQLYKVVTFSVEEV